MLFRSQVDVTFSHCCTQIMIKLLIDSVTLDLSTTPTMSITASDTVNSSWYILSGEIAPVTSINSSFRSMGVTVQSSSDTVMYGQLIMLPLQYSDSLTTQFNVTTQTGSGSSAVTNARTYEAKLPTYLGSQSYQGFMPGNCYIYYLKLTTSGIEFINVDITNWVDITVNQTPIIPSQIN